MVTHKNFANLLVCNPVGGNCPANTNIAWTILNAKTPLRLTTNVDSDISWHLFVTSVEGYPILGNKEGVKASPKLKGIDFILT